MSQLKIVVSFLVATLAIPLVMAQNSSLETNQMAAPAMVAPADSAPTVVQERPAINRTRLSQSCNAGLADKHRCSFKWRLALGESLEFLAVQHYMNRSTYDGTLKGRFFADYVNSVGQYRLSRWSDGDPFIVDYIGHPMMGAVTGRIQIQNDPRGSTLQFAESKNYWKSRARALAFSAIYAAQWELGPASETSIGNIGSFEYYSETSHNMTNGTGTVDLVMTPVGGTAWLIGEDALDKYAIARLERVSQRKLWLLAISVLNPTRSVGNVLRLKMPWYRDTRNVGWKHE
ncbi:MAG: hypothetical protein JWO13_246 [Acidobacteriales bacterium]|nr:hypothetical protein [Terriglobales bacterium]